MSDREQRIRPAGTVIALLLTALACATRTPGPPFVREADPTDDRALVYVYRSDSRPSLSPVRVRLDGRELGLLRDGEYTALEVAPGPRRIEAGVRSVAFVAWGWNDQTLLLEPGEVAYVEVSVRLAERRPAGGRALEIAGRTSGAVSENVYLRPLGAREALAALSRTTRADPVP